MFNLNEKYFSISERCGRNHQNKFCLRPLKGRLGPWELNPKVNICAVFPLMFTTQLLTWNFTKISQDLLCGQSLFAISINIH